MFGSRNPTPPKRPAVRLSYVYATVFVPGVASAKPGFHPVRDSLSGSKVGEPPGDDRSTVVLFVQPEGFETVDPVQSVAFLPTIESARQYGAVRAVGVTPP